MAWFGSKKEKKTPVRQKRRYEGASVSRLFSDFTDSERSPDAELKGALGRLRARSRDLSRNNEYVKRYFNLLKTNVVGDKGFKILVKAQNTDGSLDQIGNQAIENRFALWTRKGNCTADGRLSWTDAQKLAIEGLARDGEVFCIKHRGAGFQDTFAIEFIEPDQVDVTFDQKLSNGNEIRMGIELDRFKRPVAYHITSNHPGSETYGTSIERKRVRVPAEKVIHLFIPLRPGQTRGEPWLAPSMLAIKQLDGFREAAVINARIAASKMGFFTSPTGDGFIADDLDNQVPIMDVEPGTFHQLPDGVGFEKFDTPFPSSDFDAFHKSILRGIASGLGVSYNSLSNDLESTSYSSIRQGALEERDTYRNMQGFMVEHFIRPVFEDWLTASMEAATLSVNLPLVTFSKFANSTEYKGRAWSWVDPQKEMTAAINGFKNGILSLTYIANQYGMDVEELLSQIQRDKTLMEQFGITYALEPYCAIFNAVTPEGQEDGTEPGTETGDD